jgi:hypothetical protein
MGVLYGIRTFLPYIRSHGEGGHFVNTASMAGMVSVLGFGPYSASKFAVVTMSEGLAMQFKPLGIGASAVAHTLVNAGAHISGTQHRVRCRYRERRAGGEIVYVEVAPGAAHRVRASGNKLQLPARHGQNDRTIALRRKAWLFAGSDRGGQRAAVRVPANRTFRGHSLGGHAAADCAGGGGLAGPRPRLPVVLSLTSLSRQ